MTQQPLPIAQPLKARKTHCRKGHEMTPENTVTDQRRHTRSCKACRDARREFNHKATKEEKKQVACPACGLVRTVGKTTHRRIMKGKATAVCLSCSRKSVRSGMTFAPGVCRECGKEFVRRSGSAKVCDQCMASGDYDRNTRECPICGRMFIGYKSKKACSHSCSRRLRLNDSYFGGRMMQAEGWDEKVCQVCSKAVPRRFHVHHVFGHPNHSRLVILCPGCHDAISKLAGRKNFGSEQLKRIAEFVMAQKNGCRIEEVAA